MAQANVPMGTIKVEHVTATNAQAALQSAATVFSGGRGYSREQVVQLAGYLRGWLDGQDMLTEQARKDAS